MNVVNKYLATLSLVVGTLGAQMVVAAEVGTRDIPNLIQCDTCYSVADFERKAKTQAQSNTAGYHLVYNMNTEVVETVYTFELYEPELGVSMSNARVVNTNALHAQQFSEYVDYKKYGVEKKPKLLTIKHAGGYDGIIYNYYKPARGSWQALKYSNFLPILVVIEFDNGDVVTALIPDPRSTAIELISAVDKDGKDISSRASNSGGASGGSGGGSEGGSSSGSVTVTITGVNSGGSTLMCKPKASYLGVDCKFV
ncbi:hypothetical protein ORJ04_21755 [Rheinheimera baltica]|uniref:Secreted protein n=1 Tax=Rheinheimera baltica TaxID=67576 RepID=A0ABT9I596_9GAMM|nr:hypothetical protein [Rheinheimera baltica]MDP5138576.1 hypothetical protein [Rheinheimera baltica]MDP5151680.1 hypothetical protein [Rheinheimera baltica]